MTEALYAVTAPRIWLEGQLQSEMTRDLARLEVEEDTSGLKVLRARLLAFGPTGQGQEGLLYLDGRVVDFGKGLEVALGARPAAKTVFAGYISAIEAEFEEGREPEAVVFAEDKLMQLRMTRRTRTYESMSDADIAAEIASEHGLASDVDAEGPVYELVHQCNVSDLAFLRERARLVQAEIWLQGETLCFKSREKRDSAAITLVQGNELVSIRIRADLAHQRTEVHACGYNDSERAVIDEVAAQEVIEAEVASGKTGPQILAKALGQRVSYRVKDVPLAGAEAAEWARADMLRRSRGFVRAAGVTRGTPDMTVGSRLSLQRVGAPFEGDGYYVTRVRHTYDREQGYRTHFEAERASIRG